MKKTIVLALCATSLGLGACGLEIPDLNNPGQEALQNAPTRSSVTSAATGLLISYRANKANQNGYVAHLGILGRESYTFDAADPRFVTEMLAGASLDPGSPAFGGNFWAGPYVNIRTANTLLGAVDQLGSMTEEEKEATRGFAKTFQALEFLVIVTTRDTNGGPIDVNIPPDTLAPIVGKDEMLTRIAELLDEGKGHLERGGTSFPFPLSSGFDALKPDPKKPFMPADFLRFNRAVKARVEAYRQNWSGVLAALSESFISNTAPLSLGVYHVYGSGSGDTTNGLISTNIFVHPKVIEEAERKTPGGALDDRVTQKTREVDSRTYQGLSSKYAFTLYSSNTSPLPIIRNEELILLRAEAHIGLSNFPAAADDLNFIRTTSGGLPARTDLTTREVLIDELLEQRRYSLLFEGGHRWIDMRRYNKLNELPVDLEGHQRHERFPIPLSETDARKP